MARALRLFGGVLLALGLLAGLAGWQALRLYRAPGPLAAPAQAGIKAIWGPAEMPDGSSAFPVYKDLGVDVIEEQLSWRDVAISRPVSPRDPADPAYRWPSSLDAVVAEADHNGIKTALMVKRTPDWANGNRGEQWVPTRLGDYADFMAAAARHYATVKYWMVWGEPNRNANFAPVPSQGYTGRTGPLTRAQAAAPKRYARLLDSAYGRL